MQNKTVLLTGASGFVGRHVLKALTEQDCNIIATYHNTKISGQSNVNWIKTDINDPSSFELLNSNIDFIIHTAGLVSYDPKFEKTLYRVNQIGTANLVNFALEKSVKKFIYISSASTLRRSSDETLIHENVPGSPIFYSNYAKSKFLGEMEVRRGEAEGLDIAIINPSLILGFGDWNKGSCNIFKKAAEGLRFYPSGNVGLVMIEDVVNMIIKILFDDFNTNANILLNSETWTYKKLFDKITTFFGTKNPSIEVGNFLSKIASIADGIKSKVTSQERLISPESTYQINQKISYEQSKILQTIEYKLIPILPKLQLICDEYKLNYKN
ncbi:MAG TPA: NAD-dependent epimerase/dehydratase family protein [Saprospiraceae bacterium]|nr:NAD-dependent epimerase/dehydratase family protein [Saprospiraceae bacterium]